MRPHRSYGPRKRTVADRKAQAVLLVCGHPKRDALTVEAVMRMTGLSPTDAEQVLRETRGRLR